MEGGENIWSSATDLSWPWPDDDEEMVEEDGEAPTPPPQTPKEPMEFISQPWTLSASEIRQALLSKTKGKTSVGQVPGDMVTVDKTTFTGRKVAPPRNHLPCSVGSTAASATDTGEGEESASPPSGGHDEGIEMAGEDDGCSSVQTMITPPPQSPEEPMDFLAQSWNLSASEITRALLSSIGTMNSVGWTSTEATATEEASTTTSAAAAAAAATPRCSNVGTLWADNDRMEMINEEEELDDSVPAILPPQTPQESMEFLSRSWRLSTSEITKGLLSNTRSRNFVRWIPDTSAVHPHSSISPATMPGGGGAEEGCRRWFQPSRKSRRKKAAKKELARANGANVHAAVSAAAVAVAVAAVAASANSESSVSKLGMAMASATELLASHCTEIAEKAGADRQHLAAVVRSTVDVRTASDLMTLTAAAATALRGAAALNLRVMQGETKSNASVNPSDKDHCTGPHILFCKEGHLLKRTKTGALHWKEVSVYINKKLQVMVKLKSRNAGDTFIKKKKCAVYGVCDEVTRRPRITKIDEENRCFSLRTTKGFIEFECQNEIHKQRWVDAVRGLLSQVCCHSSSLEQSLRVLRISH